MNDAQRTMKIGRRNHTGKDRLRKKQKRSFASEGGDGSSLDRKVRNNFHWWNSASNRYLLKLNYQLLWRLVPIGFVIRSLMELHEDNSLGSIMVRRNNRESKDWSSRLNWDSRGKTSLTKSLEKQHHRTPFKQIDINKIKPGTSGAREDDDDYYTNISEEEDDQTSDPDKSVVKRVQPKPSKRRKMK